MENRNSRGMKSTGQFAAFNKVLRKVHMLMCRAVRGESKGADKKAVIEKRDTAKVLD